MQGRNKAIDENILSGEYKAVYRYALSLCKNEQDAEDIASETFLKAMKSKDSFKQESSLYTWLCAIAKNIWLNNLKKRQKAVSSDSLEQIASEEGSFEDRIDDKELAMSIHKVLHEISEPYKGVFSLRVFGQLSFSEIASLFGKTDSWARVTYHRARKMISVKLGKDGLL
ncbi:MAG: sigma-70 family RNA polymerase sigma factor [Ruminococcus sp.]|nr:sigma-70 family RNA polymerase sigma factor [Ruminococcus sp.]